MYGHLGVLYYLIERGKYHEAESVLLKINEQLTENEFGVFWYDSPTQNMSSKKNINLSLAHGSASVIVVLSRMVSYGLSDYRPKESWLKDIILKIISFIKNRQQKSESVYYPGCCTVNEKGDLLNSYSRLSWCYGDMGIGLSFWQAGNAIGDELLKKKAIEIYKQTLPRRLPNENEIVDACICHGTAGVAHMYNRMYYNTGLTVFRKAAEEWISETLKMAKYKDGFCGYKTWNGHQWHNDLSLLSGISGVRLCLLAHISKSNSNWDRCFLMS